MAPFFMSGILLWDIIVARELAPAGSRSGPKSLRALRTRAGASSLATKSPLSCCKGYGNNRSNASNGNGRLCR